MSRKRHIAVIAGLLCLSAAVQLVTVRRATVTGLDAVRFVDIARQIDRLGLWETVRAEREQPLFPVLVWIFHEGLDRANFAGLSTWPLSAQLAAATAVVFSVVPVYLLALRLVGPRPLASARSFSASCPRSPGWEPTGSATALISSCSPGHSGHRSSI
jgi:hypothetical protein